MEVCFVERYDINGIYKLLAATVKRAIHDARRDPKAAAWLDEHCPTWRRYEGQKKDCSINGVVEREVLLPAKETR